MWSDDQIAERDEMTCHLCGGGDHFARECPTRDEDEGEKTKAIPRESMRVLVFGNDNEERTAA